jgi:hypothetical protein
LIRREERLEDYFATLSFTPDALPTKTWSTTHQLAN